jgi:DNA-binding winged helix-turn-helix (wHTH) protein/tetratricopeptide (TPR) repeat protein
MTRSAAPSDPVRVRFDRFELDEANASLLCEGSPVALPPTPFAVLCALARKPGSLITKHALLDEVWGHRFVSDSVLKSVITKLRTTLQDDARQPRFIETVSRRGYRFVASLVDTASRPAAAAVGAGPLQVASFTGRAEALARLRSNWELACGGRRSVVWVAGEPGIGKTTLIEHFIAQLAGAACVRGQCVEQYGAGEPYLPVLEAVAELCRSDGEVVSLLRAVAPTWLLQLPWLSTAEDREALRRELAGASPERMLREMGEVLDRYTERRPLLLVTEDLHWSDRATIQLIDYIARRRGSARLMWLASFRITEVVALEHPLNPVRHELRLHGLCEEIVLDPFSESEVADYVAERAPALAGDEAFARALHSRTDGVPLFLASVMRDVIENGGQETHGALGTERLERMAVPENLVAIIDHYIARLGIEQRVLLSAAAVCGAEFRIDMLAEVLERDASSVGQACEDLAREKLWLVPSRAGERGTAPSFAFRHALFRQVLYERTALQTRSQLHRNLGGVLERERANGTPVAAAELAMHFERGHEPVTALRYCAEAAEAALAHLSPADCMSLTEGGSALLDQVPDGLERDSLEITLATLRGVSATHVLGMGIEAKSAFERAYNLLPKFPHHPMSGRLLQGLGFLYSLRAEYAEALAVAERAEALSSTNDPLLVVAACIVYGVVHQLQGRSRAARSALERGLAAAEPLDAAAGETFVADPQVTLLGLLGIELLRLGLIAQAQDRLQQAHARARKIQQPMTRLVATWDDALFHVRIGDAQRVAALAGEMQALVDEFALAQGRAAARWFGGWAAARMGRPLEGYRRIRAAYDENRRLGMVAGSSEILGYAAEALLLAGDREGAQRELDEALRVASAHDEHVYLPQLFLIEAALAGARGEPDVAADAARRAVAEARWQEAPWLELLALLQLCEHDAATGADRDALAALVERLPEAGGVEAVARARALLEATKAHGA